MRSTCPRLSSILFLFATLAASDGSATGVVIGAGTTGAPGSGLIPPSPGCFEMELNYGIVNVKCYDAKGDGDTDDTLAIQKAADRVADMVLAGHLSRAFGSGDGNLTRPAVARATASTPVLYFPAGLYRLTAPIEFEKVGGGERIIKSDGNAIVFQTNPTSDLFRFTYGLNVEVSGLRFVGGRHQIFYDNSNENGMQLIIRNVEFQNNETGAALLVGDDDCAQEGEPCFDTCDDPTRPPECQGKCLQDGCRWISTHVLIDDCKFLSNWQAMVLRADTVEISDTWIEATEYTDPNNPNNSLHVYDGGHVEHHGGKLTMNNVVCVPIVPPTMHPRLHWISSYGNRVALSDCRFGGELGGLPIIYWYAGDTNTITGYPFARGFGISAHECSFRTGALARVNRGLIRLVDSVPERIVLVDNHTMVRHAESLIKMNSDFNLEQAIDAGENANVDYVFTFRGNQVWDSMDLQVPGIAASGLPEPIRERANRH